MDRLRREDVSRGIHDNRINIRGSTYRTLRLTGGTAGFAYRTSGKAMRTAGNLAMNRIRRTLLECDRTEIRKYLSEEEARKWASLSSFQKRKIIKQAEKYAEKAVGRGSGIRERSGVLKGKMSRTARQNALCRYEVGSQYLEDTYVSKPSYHLQEAYLPESYFQETYTQESYGQKIDGALLNKSLLIVKQNFA